MRLQSAPRGAAPAAGLTNTRKGLSLRLGAD